MVRWLVFLAIAVAPVRAAAWTEAHIETAHATLELEPDRTVAVSIELRLRIARGWLEQLELAGFDPSLQLLGERPASMARLEDPTVKYHPTVSQGKDGTLRLRFLGRGASPRRGQYLVRFHYQADLEPSQLVRSDAGDWELRWTLPPWRNSLDDVSVTLVLPTPDGKPIEALSNTTPIPDFTFRAVHASKTTTFIFRRGHLPRGTGWQVGARVPAGALSRNVSDGTDSLSPFPTGNQEPEHETLSPGLIWFAAMMGVWLLVTTLLFQAVACKRGARARNVFPLPTPIQALATGALLCGGLLLFPEHTTASFALFVLASSLWLQRTPMEDDRPSHNRNRNSSQPLDEQRWELASGTTFRWARWQRLGERLGLQGFVDITTPLGAAIVAGASAASYWLLNSETVPSEVALALIAVAIAPLCSATRIHLPSSVGSRLLALREIAERTKGSHTACGLEVWGKPPAHARLTVIQRDEVYHLSVSEAAGPGGTTQTLHRELVIEPSASA